MFRNTLFAASLLILGTVATAPKTMAQTAPAPNSLMPQTVEVPFSGQVTGVCNVGQITPGSLMPSTAVNPTGLMSDAPTTTTPNSASASAGKVVVTCNAPASIMVSKPMQVSGPAFNPMKSDAFVRMPGSPTLASAMNTAPARLPIIANPVPLEVGMMVDKGSPLTPGTYNYKVTLTIAP
jgi:hypothetical protein